MFIILNSEMWNIMFWRYSMMWKVLGKFQLLGCWTIWGHIRASQLGCFKFCYVLGWKRGKICATIEFILESVVWLPAEFWVFVEALHTLNRSKTRTLNVVLDIQSARRHNLIGDNFFQKSLSFQLPLTRLQKSQNQILRVILEK